MVSNNLDPRPGVPRATAPRPVTSAAGTLAWYENYVRGQQGYCLLLAERPQRRWALPDFDHVRLTAKASPVEVRIFRV